MGFLAGLLLAEIIQNCCHTHSFTHSIVHAHTLMLKGNAQAQSLQHFINTHCFIVGICCSMEQLALIVPLPNMCRVREFGHTVQRRPQAPVRSIKRSSEAHHCCGHTEQLTANSSKKHTHMNDRWRWHPLASHAQTPACTNPGVHFCVCQSQVVL